MTHIVSQMTVVDNHQTGINIILPVQNIDIAVYHAYTKRKTAKRKRYFNCSRMLATNANAPLADKRMRTIFYFLSSQNGLTVANVNDSGSFAVAAGRVHYWIPAALSIVILRVLLLTR